MSMAAFKKIKMMGTYTLKWGLSLFSTNKTIHVPFLKVYYFIIIMHILYSENLYKRNMLILILELEMRYSLSNWIKGKSLGTCTIATVMAAFSFYV